MRTLMFVVGSVGFLTGCLSDDLSIHTTVLDIHLAPKVSVTTTFTDAGVAISVYASLESNDDSCLVLPTDMAATLNGEPMRTSVGKYNPDFGCYAPTSLIDTTAQAAESHIELTDSSGTLSLELHATLAPIDIALADAPTWSLAYEVPATIREMAGINVPYRTVSFNASTGAALVATESYAGTVSPTSSFVFHDPAATALTGTLMIEEFSRQDKCGIQCSLDWHRTTTHAAALN